MKSLFERIELQDGEALACFDWSGQTFLCPYHVHPEAEINYIVSSSGRRLVGDALDDFKAGDLVLFGPNLPHMYFHRAPAHAPRNWAHSRYIQFLPDCLGASFFDKPALSSIRELLTRAQRGVIFPRATVRKALPLLSQTLSNTGARRIAFFLHLLQTLAESRDARLMASEQFGLPKPSPVQKRLDAATSFIHRNLTGDITLQQVSRHVFMSPQGFSRFFHKHMGRTFASYLSELRVGTACNLLLESDLNIAGICFASGFGNLSNFNRQFRAIKGISPREFRRQILE